MISPFSAQSVLESHKTSPSPKLTVTPTSTEKLVAQNCRSAPSIYAASSGQS